MFFQNFFENTSLFIKLDSFKSHFNICVRPYCMRYKTLACVCGSSLYMLTRHGRSYCAAETTRAVHVVNSTWAVCEEVLFHSLN